jgi:hypothetical protein
MILRTFFFFWALLWVLPANAKSPQQICQEKAADVRQVNIRYKYGKLGLKQKSSAEISAYCGDNAAGCCHSSGGKYFVQTTFKTIQSGEILCVVPIVNVDFDFSGTYIEITDEYDACKTRAVLRHELQHFMIWKTGREQQLAQTREKLGQLARQRITACVAGDDCDYQYSNDEFVNLVQKIAAKWQRVIKANNKNLDENDHDFKKEVNYRVCMPYSVEKISLFH